MFLPIFIPDIQDSMLTYIKDIMLIFHASLHIIYVSNNYAIY